MAVKCIFNGRLGNQLFELAHVISEGLHHQVPVVLGRWENLEWFPQCKVYSTQTSLDNITHQEQFFQYHQQPFIPGYCNEYSGYYQSEKYFETHRNTVVEMLTPKVSIEMPSGEWCAIHVRRTDYVLVPQLYPLPTTDYFRQALEEVGLVDGYIIFSDDLDWCKQHIAPLLTGTIKYEDELARNHVEALWCMSRCKHLIGANSSFSWWGAYLGDQNGIKIFPKIWFGPVCSHNTIDLIPSRWKRL